MEQVGPLIIGVDIEDFNARYSLVNYTDFRTSM